MAVESVCHSMSPYNIHTLVRIIYTQSSISVSTGIQESLKGLRSTFTHYVLLNTDFMLKKL